MSDTIQVLTDSNPYPTSVKKSKLKYLFLTVVSLILIFAMSATYLFWWAPQVQAKEYLEETSKDFEVVAEKLIRYEAAFINISKAFKKSQQAFYEITESRTYFEAVDDTQQDISDIQETLSLIDEAVITKENLKVPDDFESLDETLTDYYTTVEKGMKLLLEYEQLQLSMLNASGDELNTELEKMQTLIAEGGGSQKFVDYFDRLESLAVESVFRLESIKDVPEIHKNYFEIKFEYHQDVQNTSKTLKEKYRKGTPTAYEEATETLTAFSNRNIERNKRQKEDSKYFVNNSPIKQLFEDSVKIETKIKEEFTALKTKYGVENLSEATSSAVPKGPTNSATP